MESKNKQKITKHLEKKTNENVEKSRKKKPVKKLQRIVKQLSFNRRIYKK